MESAVANLVRPGDRVLACAAGKFGERWIELGEAYGADVVRYEPGWGERLDPAEVDRLLGENPEVNVVLATQSETSTGIVHDVRRSPRSRRSTTRSSSSTPSPASARPSVRQDEWGIDVVVAGSQKALMSPPGLGFASVSQRALDFAAERPGGRYYFDWGKHRQAPSARSRTRPSPRR